MTTNDSTCGCRVATSLPIGRWTGDVTALITYCPLHSAAPEMKEALEELGGWFDGPADWSDSDLGNWVRKHLWRKVAPILRKATLPASGGAS